MILLFTEYILFNLTLTKGKLLVVLRFLLLQECYLERVTTVDLSVRYNAGCRSSRVCLVRYYKKPNSKDI